MDLQPDPVDILGIAVIQRSPSNSEDGPWFFIDSRKTPPFIEVKPGGCIWKLLAGDAPMGPPSKRAQIC